MANTGKAFRSNGQDYVCVGEWPERGTVYTLNAETGKKQNISVYVFEAQYREIAHTSATRLAFRLNSVIQ